MDNKRHCQIFKTLTKTARKVSKNRTSENEMNYKNYVRLLESVKRKSKNFFHSKQLIQLQGDTKKRDEL